MPLAPDALRQLQRALAELPATLRGWPWLDTLYTLRERLREDRLGVTASSLTFTTLLALVPLLTVMLAVFSAFPIFTDFEKALEKYFLQSLVPDHLARPVLAALTQFAQKAQRLGSVGLVSFLVTAIALLLTVDRALNAIWRVRRPRPLAQRVVVYWGALTLGPLVLGVSLSMVSLAISASRGVVGALPGGLGLLLGLLEFTLRALAAAALFRYVPNTTVAWRHAVAGGVFVSVGIEIAQTALARYLAAVPTFDRIYGAFATVPVMLLWIYIVWVIVLLGAVIAAYAPSLQRRVVRRQAVPGQRFALALDVLRMLAQARQGEARGVALLALAEGLGVDPLQLEPVAEALVDLDWAARLDEPGREPRLVLLAEPATTVMAPLVDSLLLAPEAGAAGFRAGARLASLRLADALD